VKMKHDAGGSDKAYEHAGAKQGVHAKKDNTKT
jgi:hypothetical protein